MHAQFASRHARRLSDLIFFVYAQAGRPRRPAAPTPPLRTRVARRVRGYIPIQHPRWLLVPGIESERVCGVLARARMRVHIGE
eukprot:6209152-Pleurochrysis_carterae.AAC.4